MAPKKKVPMFSDFPTISLLPRNLICFLSQTYEEALEAQKAKKEAKKPSKGKNSEVNNKKKKWKKSNKGDGADKHDAVSDLLDSHKSQIGIFCNKASYVRLAKGRVIYGNAELSAAESFTFVSSFDKLHIM